ncbi:MAG: hypothetical protein AVDCRST_MAG85-748, partial [uncultured Solirubrobacteraceae bacterium]
CWSSSSGRSWSVPLRCSSWRSSDLSGIGLPKALRAPPPELPRHRVSVNRPLSWSLRSCSWSWRLPQRRCSRRCRARRRPARLRRPPRPGTPAIGRSRIFPRSGRRRSSSVAGSTGVCASCVTTRAAAGTIPAPTGGLRVAPPAPSGRWRTFARRWHCRGSGGVAMRASLRTFQPASTWCSCAG